MQKRLYDLSNSIAIVGFTLFVLLLWPDLLTNLLSSGGFIPHGHCYLWKPELVWLHVASDALIGLAYVSISATLAYLVYKTRDDIPFHWVFLAFGLFIIACGSTHFIEIWTLWTPIYWLSGSIKLITAVASITTAMALPPLVPQVLALLEAAKTSEERRLKLETANPELEALYEKLKQLDQLKSQFFANVSHELRTPLALILEPTERLLESRQISSWQHQYLEVVHRNALILLKRVNDLLDVSKLEAGKMALNYTKVDLAQLVRLTGAHFEPLAQECQISFSIETPSSLPAQIDPEKIQRVCFNLLSNALKFTPNGGSIRFTLKDLRKPEQNPLWEITVEDSGSGVPPELREAIFERFQQGEGVDNRHFGGTGLGLAIVKEFVELHGGTITVGDAPSGGALFSIFVPLVAPSGAKVLQHAVDTSYTEEIAAQVLAELSDGALPSQDSWVMGEEEADSQSLIATSQLPKPLVLVVEDNREMNLFISRTLATEYATVTAFNGREGLEKAMQLRPDLILSDIMMPQMTGEQLVQEIRKCPELNAIPIVLLSAKADDELRVQMLRNGAQDYLMKPCSSEELRARVGNLVAMKRVRTVLQQELSTTHQDLATLANEVASRNRELQQLAAELESRVEQRTIELQTANALLKQQIAERQQAEECLRQSEERFRSYFELPLVGIAITSPEKGWLEVNDKLCDIFGYSRQELMSMSWAELTHPNDLEADVEQFNRVLAGYSEGYSMEKRFVRQDCTCIHASIAVQCVRRADSSVDYFVVLVEEITKRKQAEEQIHTLNAKLEQRVIERTAQLETANRLKDELLLSEQAARAEAQAAQQYYRLLTEAIPQLVWTARPDGYVDYYNQRWFEYTGFTEEQSLALEGWQAVLHPEDLDICVNHWYEAVRTGKSYQIEYRLKRVDGVYRWHLGRALPLRDDGKIVKWFGTCTDIDDQKRAEEAVRFLAEASTLLATSLDYETTLKSLVSLAVPYLADYCVIDVLETKGQIRRLCSSHTNPEKKDLVRELWQYSPDLSKSEGVAKVMRTGKSSIVFAPSESLLEAIVCDANHLRLLRELGVKAYATIPLLVNKRILGTLTFVITESCRPYDADELALAEEVARRAALAIDNARLYREAQEANRMKDEFLAIVSHELRTPINAVLGWATLLRNRKFDAAKTNQALETIERNAKLQTQLIEDILDVSRMIRGQLQLQVRPVHLSAVIDAAIQTVLPAAQTKSVEVEAILEPDLEPVAGDFNRLQQVMWNLVANAIKFTPAGGHVQVRLCREWGMGQGDKGTGGQQEFGDASSSPLSSQSPIPFAQIQVSDTGKGISAEFLPYVFDQFRQENSSTTRSHGGLGLGLAIVRHLVELHGGQIYANSAGDGQGATFTVQLPLLGSREHRELKSRGETKISFDPVALTGLQVLVVDDEADIRDVITTVLEQYGAGVRAVASVQEALDVLKSWQPDILISDIGMPVADGYALIHQLRAQEAELGKRIPAIALSAYTRQKDRQQALAAGFHKHISKPVEPAQLVAVVAKLAGRVKKIH